MAPRRLTTLVLSLLVASLALGIPGPAPSAAPRTGANDPAVPTGTGPLPNFSARGPNLIRLQAGAFDPLAGGAPRGALAPVGESSLPAGQAQYWLVQVRDGRFLDVARAVEGAGARVAGYLPDATFLVRATPEQRAELARHEAVRWSGYYQPRWRIPVAANARKGLLDLQGTRVFRVYLFSGDPDTGAVAEAIRGMSAVEIVDDAGTVLDVRTTARQIPAIAALPAVEWIGVRPRVSLLNANARWVNDTGIRDVYAATAPGRLTGAGQTAAVADTGVNYTYDLNGRAHIGFRDCNSAGLCKEAIYTQRQAGTSAAAMNDVIKHNTGHRKMVAYFDLGATGPNPFDPSSHGSHVGGSVTGDQNRNGVWDGDDGLAPGARHVHQNIGSSSGGLALPGDDYDLWRQAYRPRDPANVLETSGANGNPAGYSTAYRPLEDARTHNNSYGLIVPIVDEGSGTRLDRFVWDHEDMVIVVSAGNAGPDAGSIGSPSVAKNELSSGAAANGRQPMASIDTMASFSSHGPTADGRFGVDLATPGQIVVSAKGGSTDGYHVAQGTSMSGPVLTGLATLVRQYFWDGYGPAGGQGFAVGASGVGANGVARRHNPSAALVRAALVNGAVRMRGWYTGDDGTDRALDGQWPSAGQGFGRVTLDNSLFFANDPTNNWYYDVYRADPDAFPISSGPATRSYEIDVAAGAPLDVTLSWTDAPLNLAAGSPALVNNLNLVVTGPSGSFVGNNMNSRIDPAVDAAETLPGLQNRDVRNPTERVRILDPQPGTYTVTVEAPPIAQGNQGFALAASGLISSVGEAFTAGPPLQVDEAGNPTIAGPAIDPISADVARITFATEEPTTATATLDLDPDEGTNEFTFVDSYNIGNDVPELGAGPGWPGLDEGPVETSDEYANKPVVGTRHEILVTGLRAGGTYSIEVQATDLGGNSVTETVEHVSPTNAYQPLAGDTAQLTPTVAGVEPIPIPIPLVTGWRLGTQMYAGVSAGAGLLGAFMFRIPEDAIDPSEITGAVVELTSSHNWVVPYNQDPVLYVDLLDDVVEPNWGTQDYSQIHNAPLDARAYPETTHKRGDYFKYPFTFRCRDLERLRQNLSTVVEGQRNAAFRYDATPPGGTGIFSMEFGFNRRSKGPSLRPRLILLTGNQSFPGSEVCDADTPAPTISDIGIHLGIEDTENTDPSQPPPEPGEAVTVSWETDVDADSMVLFREKGTTKWIQVGSPARTRIHQVQVFGLDTETDYQFMVRSRACNGATTTDTNLGKGYDFFRAPPPVIPTEDYFFHGTPDDEANKQAAFTTGDESLYTSTFSTDPPDEVAGLQNTTGLANQDFVGNPLTALWVGDFSGEISGDVPFSWYWSTENAEAVAAGADVSVTFFADPDFDADDPVQPQRVIGRGVMRLNFTAPGVPTLNEGFVPVSGTVQQRLLIQAAGVSLTAGNALVAHYDSSATPSKFGVPLEPAPPSEPLPLTGPVPPPSAGAIGLVAPAPRFGPASAADIAAGTAQCALTVLVRAVGHAHSDYNDDGRPGLGDVHIRVDVQDEIGTQDPPGGFVEYRDLRRDPPGVAAGPITCTTNRFFRLVRTNEGRGVRIEGEISCDRPPAARTFILEILDRGSPPDSYRMRLFAEDGRTLYDWAGTTTPRMGDLLVVNRLP